MKDLTNEFQPILIINDQDDWISGGVVPFDKKDAFDADACLKIAGIMEQINSGSVEHYAESMEDGSIVIYAKLAAN